jgi:Tol biopolymer transport system component
MPSLSPDGKFLAFIRAAKPKSQSMGGVQWGEFDVYVAQPDGKDEVALTTTKYVRATAPRWSDDAARIVFSALDVEGRWWTQEIEVATKKVLRKIEGKNNESMPTFVGERIAIVSDRERAGRYRVGFVDSAGVFEPIVAEEGYFLDLQESGGKLFALEDVTHKMRFRISEIDPATGAIREVIPESQFDEKAKP